MARPIVYTVHAYRWGDRELHSYTVGVYSKKAAALKAAEAETEYRGGKYECEVIEFEVDIGGEGRRDNPGKTIKELPKINTLEAHNNESSKR